jgi:hypothetical protein
MPERNPFSSKIICGECGNIYSRVIYKDRKGRKISKWRCGSTNKAGGRRVCSNRYIFEESLVKLFEMRWNSIAGNYADYESKWGNNLESGNELLRHKTRQIMERAKNGKIREFDPKLMIEVMDIITVYESGNLRIRFYDGTEFSYETA